MSIVDRVKRLFSGQPVPQEELAWELAEHLAQAFSDDPGIEVMPPMSWQETLDYLGREWPNIEGGDNED
jgi:hypothetical protein